MDPIRKSARLLSLVMISAAVAACGGGGGSAGAPGTPPAPNPVPPPPPPPPPPAPPQTGLTAPSLNLSTSTDVPTLVSAFRQLASEMARAYDQAAGAAAAQEVAKLRPGTAAGQTSPANCPAGGTITFSGAAALVYTYANCATNGYTFNSPSTATMTPVVSGGALQSYSLQYGGLAATGPSAFSGTLNGSSDCTVSGATANCVTKIGGFVWGFDSTFVAAAANGTHQCDCGAGAWNVLFDDFTATSGIAYVYATNGTAIATRTGAKTFTVTQTLTGGTPVQFDVVIP